MDMFKSTNDSYVMGGNGPTKKLWQFAINKNNYFDASTLISVGVDAIG